MLAPILVGSLCFYFGGMIGNDLVDFEQDSQLRPERILPSKRISLHSARTSMLILVAIGLVCATIVTVIHQSWLTLGLAILLVAAIWFYNAVAKERWFGSVSMAACRVINLYFVVAHLLSQNSFSSDLLASPHMYPLGIGLYVGGLTLFAENEERESKLAPLVASTLILALGLLAIFLVGNYDPLDPWTKLFSINGMILLLLIFPVIRSVLVALSSLTSGAVQAAVVTMLRSMIVIDAFVCFSVSDGQFWIVIAILLLPAFFLGRWIRST